MLAVTDAPEPDVRAGHVTLQHAPELAWLDMARETERLGPAAAPVARLAVLVRLPGVVVRVRGLRAGNSAPSRTPS